MVTHVTETRNTLLSIGRAASTISSGLMTSGLRLCRGEKESNWRVSSGTVRLGCEPMAFFTLPEAKKCADGGGAGYGDASVGGIEDK